MKIRNGFVSNSSSSSFICDISGRSESGYDMSMEDTGMYECVNGHTIDEDYVLDYDYKELVISILETQVASHGDKYGDEKYLNDIKKLDGDDVEEYVEENEIELELRYSLPEIACPICQLKHSTKDDMVSYLLKELGKTGEDVQGEIKVKFSDYDAFKKHIDG